MCISFLSGADCGQRLLWSQAGHVTLQQQHARLDAIRLLTPQVLLQRTRHRLAQAQTRLELLSPKGTLARGYSITRQKDTGKVLRGVADVKPGTKLSTIVLGGEFGSVVEKPTEV